MGYLESALLLLVGHPELDEPPDHRRILVLFRLDGFK